jgi:hypothetical protein
VISAFQNSENSGYEYQVAPDMAMTVRMIMILILCRDENRTIAEYALRDMSKPIGVSEYHLCTDLPLDLKNALPAVEDIRNRIDMKK